MTTDITDKRKIWNLKLDLTSNSERKSAFLPYKPSTTVLTNLQRGNTEATISEDVLLTFHERSGQGEITNDQAKNEQYIDGIDENNYTPLHWACYYGQHSSVQILLNYEADVNQLAPDMVSPLLLAASGGHHEVVKLLLQNGADVNHTDIIGNTALMYAAAGNYPHTCNELLSCNIDITESNENGDTAYNLAVQNSATLSQAVLDNFIVSLLTL